MSEMPAERISKADLIAALEDLAEIAERIVKERAELERHQAEAAKAIRVLWDRLVMSKDPCLAAYEHEYPAIQRAREQGEKNAS